MQRDIRAARRDLWKANAARTGAATLAGCLNNLWPRHLAQSGFSGRAAQSRSDLRPWARYPEKTDLLMLADRPPLLETPLHHFITHGKDSCWIVTLGSTCFRMRRWSHSISFTCLESGIRRIRR